MDAHDSFGTVGGRMTESTSSALDLVDSADARLDPVGLSLGEAISLEERAALLALVAAPSRFAHAGV